jgi:hypothetical protein
MRARAHVRLVAAVWLTCQVAAFAASPFVLCHDHSVMSQTADGHECDPKHHHHGQSDDGAALKCRCIVSDAALAALILDVGILPGAFAFETNVAAMPVVPADYSAPTRSHIPDTPPPRA